MALNHNVVASQEEAIVQLVHTPTFLMVAGALPGLFVASSLESGIIIGVVSAVSILAAAAISQLVGRFTGTYSRGPVALLLNTTVVVLVGFVVRVLSPVVYQDLGIYVPLTSASGAAALFIAQESVWSHENVLTLRDAGIAAVGGLCVLAICGLLTGLFASGQVAGITISLFAESPVSIFGTPAGSLLLLSLASIAVQAATCRRPAVADADAKKDGE